MSVRKLLHLFRRLDAWLVAPAIIVVVFGELTHIPLAQKLEIDVWDKALHFTAYFGLALMTTIAVRAERRALWWALGLVVLGGALEIVQGSTGRDADIFDELANSLGVAAGLGLGWAGIALLKARRVLDGEFRGN
ncbi:MAG TPA: VanZ family protein [Rhizomicrobium sp.]